MARILRPEFDPLKRLANLKLAPDGRLPAWALRICLREIDRTIERWRATSERQ